MKNCLICGAKADDGAVTCLCCGEGSFSASERVAVVAPAPVVTTTVKSIEFVQRNPKRGH